MVVVIMGVMKFIPVPNITPPVAAECQVTTPADDVAPKVACPLPQTLPGVVPVIVGIGMTVTVITVLEGLEHPDALNASA
jgi:hypothetical protein